MSACAIFTRQVMYSRPACRCSGCGKDDGALLTVDSIASTKKAVSCTIQWYNGTRQEHLVFPTNNPINRVPSLLFSAPYFNSRASLQLDKKINPNVGHRAGVGVVSFAVHRGGGAQCMPNGEICSFASKYPQKIVSLSYIHSQVCCAATHPFLGVTAYEPCFAIM